MLQIGTSHVPGTSLIDSCSSQKPRFIGLSRSFWNKRYKKSLYTRAHYSAHREQHTLYYLYFIYLNRKSCSTCSKTHPNPIEMNVFGWNKLWNKPFFLVPLVPPRNVILSLYILVVFHTTVVFDYRIFPIHRSFA